MRLFDRRRYELYRVVVPRDQVTGALIPERMTRETMHVVTGKSRAEKDKEDYQSMSDVWASSIKSKVAHVTYHLTEL